LIKFNFRRNSCFYTQDTLKC